jgi:glucose-6-phosphate 1-epimerase
VAAIDGVVWTDGPGGLPFLRVETDRCRARLTSYGAQLCEWVPAGESPVLYMSPHALFAAGTPIRGGVPISFHGLLRIPPIRTSPRTASRERAHGRSSR